EGHREGVLCLAAARGKPHRLARGGLLLASLAEAAAHRGEAQPRGGVIALAADGGAEGGLGGGPLALTLEGEAELELRLDAAGIEGQRGGERLLGVRVAPLPERAVPALEAEGELRPPSPGDASRSGRGRGRRCGPPRRGGGAGAASPASAPRCRDR